MANAHRGDTDKTTKIELPSAIEQIAWSRGIASPGGEIALGVFTHYVGNGSELEIELSDNSGKQIDTLKEKLVGNRFWTTITIPENARDALFADVILQKHGLSKRSPALVLTPPVKITDVKWDKEEIHRGEKATLTATVEGVPDGMEAEISIWENDEEGAHELVTKFPGIVRDGQIEAEWEFEYHDDTDDIPTEEETEKGYRIPEYFFRVSMFGTKAESELIRFKDWIEIELSTDESASGIRYVLYLPDGTTREGKLDSDGRSREDDMPPGGYIVDFPDLNIED
jgi:hypothetical protein